MHRPAWAADHLRSQPPSGKGAGWPLVRLRFLAAAVEFALIRPPGPMTPAASDFERTEDGPGRTPMTSEKDHPLAPAGLPIDPDLAPDPGRPSSAHHRSRGWWSRVQLDVLAVIAVGGAVGSPLRYEIAQAIQPTAAGFPTATFLTNTAGCLGIGVVLVLLVERLGPSRYLRPLIATGFLAALSTFSTMVVEISLLVREDRTDTAAVYLAATVAAGGLAVWVGLISGRWLPLGAGRPPGEST